MRPINCGFRSLKGKASIVNPVNKLFSLGYKVEQTFFVPGKNMNWVNNVKEACCLRVIIVIETYLVKMCYFSRNSSVWE